MAETDDPAADHVVIDVEAGAAEDDDEGGAAATATSSSSCVVCMEPMEWVAVTPCGHGEVCARCAARIRFFHNDRCCCICRSHCATVVVTKASTATTQRERGALPLKWPLPPPAAAFGGLQGLVAGGFYYWYHRGMGAYFDDLSLYQEMSKVCAAAAVSASSEESGAASGRQASDAADAPVEELEERPLSRQVISDFV